MEPNKILSANILDLIFDDRNKEYGAYELRVTYPERIKKSLLLVFAIAAVAITGVAWASSIKPDNTGRLNIKELTLADMPPEDKKVEPLPEVKKVDPPPQIKTEKLTQFDIVPDEKADKDIPTKDDFEDAIIDLAKNDGIVDQGLAAPKDIDDGKGIVENKTTVPEGPFTTVEIDAKFTGNWEKFLTRNLNANVPVDNNAPAGRYNVIIQFVVDLDGNVSDIKPLTAHGYGMEEEAVRVLKKATKWEPAIQNGHQVKAYRRQPITFIIEEQ